MKKVLKSKKNNGIISLLCIQHRIFLSRPISYLCHHISNTWPCYCGFWPRGHAAVSLIADAVHTCRTYEAGLRTAHSLVIGRQKDILGASTLFSGLITGL